MTRALLSTLLSHIVDVSKHDYSDVVLPGLDILDAPLIAETAGPKVRKVGKVISDPGLNPSAGAVDRFNKKVVRSPGCWFWIGAISTPDGYGRFTWQESGRQRTMLAHRFALLVSGADLDGSIVGEHECNEPLCVRVSPVHVHASTQAANMAYAASLGRLRGPRPGSSSGINRAERSKRIRTALAQGWNYTKFLDAIGMTDFEEARLF